MKSTRWLWVVALSAGSMALLFAGCGSKTCGAASCANGCCDASGNCVTATNASSCGTSGATCAVCQVGQLCTLGTCTLPSGSGGGGGTSSTGGGNGSTGGGNGSTGGGNGTGGGSGTGGGGGGSGLIGTWTLTTTPSGGSPTTTTLIIGQDALNVMGSDWSLSAIRANNIETYVSGGGTVTATQTAGSFNSGVIPFSMGGAWVITGGDTGSSPPLHCNMTVGPAEIDAECSVDDNTDSDFNFIFTTTRASQSSSVYGDFGGTWNHTWHHTSDGGSMATDTCVLNFGGSNIITCNSGNSVLANITFTLNAAQNMASGTAQGTEFSAVKQ